MRCSEFAWFAQESRFSCIIWPHRGYLFEGCGVKGVDPEALSRAITFAKARCLIQLPRFALFFWKGGLQLNGVTCEILSAWWAQCCQDMRVCFSQGLA